jgi:drug/metabolite transporter (DMT)-like permease
MFAALDKNRLRFLLLCVIWGSTWIGTKMGIKDVPPLMFAGTRFTAAGGLLLLYAWAKGEAIRLKKDDLVRLYIVSILLITLCYGPLFWGMQFIDSGTAAVLELSLTPIALLGFALMLGEEVLNTRRIVAMVLGVAGLLVLFWPSAEQGSLPHPEAFPRASLIGGIAVASAAFTYSFGSVLARPLLRAYPASLLAGMTTFVGGLSLIVIALVFESGAFAALSGKWGLLAWLSWVFLVICGSLIGYTTYMRLLRDVGASRAGSYAFVSPVVAVALGTMLFDEKVTATDVGGMIVMLSGAYLAMTDAPKKDRAAPDT